MNKYQEALKFFIKLANRVPLKFANDEFCERFDKNIVLIKELVDRATQKKYEEKEQIVNGISIIHAVCPNCGIEIDEFEHLKGCPYCLQALDWNGEE